jgi:hypothetical protein
LTGGGVVWDLPNYTGFIGANHINWTNCALLQGSAAALFPGNDFWIFDRCEIGNATYGIYGFYDSQTRGPNAIRINNCYIHDIDTTNYPDEGGDGHGIGARDTSNWVVTGNRLERTASSIDFFVDDGWYRTNNLIEHNFVKDVRLTHPIGTEGTGGGILFEGGTTAGRSISNRVNGNILLNIGVGATHDWQGEGIGAGGIDYIQILNNTIDTCHSGITISSSTPLNAKVENNIIANPEFRYIDFVGTGAATNLTLDYNLYYPIHELTNQFRLFPAETHDVHSVFANPRFASGSPSVSADFKLQVSSAAIGAGTLVGLTYDFAGIPIPTTHAPDIGAFQSSSSRVAASCSQADVQAMINISGPGDTVIIPAGTCTYTGTLTNFNGVNIIGAGIDQTIIVDEVPRSPNKVPVISLAGNDYDFSGVTIRGGVTNLSVNDNGAMKVSGRNWRIHHIKEKNLHALGMKLVARVGTIDHSIFDLPDVEAMQVYDSDGVGNASWNTDVLWGTTNAVVVEDNEFYNNNFNPCLDSYAGSLVTFRFNTVSNSWIGNHGTDSSQYLRSARDMEIYNNTFLWPPVGLPNTPWPRVIYFRGGSAVVFSNTASGRFTKLVSMASYRSILNGSVDGSPNWVPWGGATGTNVWDGNTDITGYPCIDQVGRGTGDLITNTTPKNATLGGIAKWPRNALEPVYIWSNNVAGIDAPQQIAGTEGLNIVANRDYFTGVAKPGYTPLVHPSPRVSGSIQPVQDPFITAQPQNQSVTVGQAATFTVSTTGNSPRSYQWQLNGNNVGTNGTTYVKPNCQLGDSGSVVRVVVTDTAGSLVSINATLTVIQDPIITVQPQNTTVLQTTPAVFNVTASGGSPLSYQWKKNGTNIVGATLSTCVTPGTSLLDNQATFSVIVSDLAGSLPSISAVLTVQPTNTAPVIKHIGHGKIGKAHL